MSSKVQDKYDALMLLMTETISSKTLPQNL